MLLLNEDESTRSNLICLRIMYIYNLTSMKYSCEYFIYIFITYKFILIITNYHHFFQKKLIIAQI